MFSFLEFLPTVPEITLLDVGAAASDQQLASDPFNKLLAQPSVTVIGFEPYLPACEARNKQAADSHYYLPYFIGDGSKRTFYQCKNPLTSSLYKPNTELLSYFQQMEEIQVASSYEVQTKRLQDIEEVTHCDIIKIDVQGAELDVLKGMGKKLLAETLIVHAEVGYIPIYHDQPLFSDVDLMLRQQGFYLHRFHKNFSRQFKPLKLNNTAYSGGSQLMFAEAAIYVKDFTRFTALPAEKLLALAWVLHDIYGSVDMVCVVLKALDQISGSHYQQPYIDRLRKEKITR
ncbi:MAG: FkbM family methyltransferase [Alphaproteobacteria bacterium]